MNLTFNKSFFSFFMAPLLSPCDAVLAFCHHFLYPPTRNHFLWVTVFSCRKSKQTKQNKTNRKLEVFVLPFANNSWSFWLECKSHYIVIFFCTIRTAMVSHTTYTALWVIFVSLRWVSYRPGWHWTPDPPKCGNYRYVLGDRLLMNETVCYSDN